jgi:hypothetical protein
MFWLPYVLSIAFSLLPVVCSSALWPITVMTHAIVVWTVTPTWRWQRWFHHEMLRQRRAVGSRDAAERGYLLCSIRHFTQTNDSAPLTCHRAFVCVPLGPTLPPPSPVGLQRQAVVQDATLEDFKELPPEAAVSVSSAPRNEHRKPSNGLGKCWAKGTRLLMWDGSSQAVEEIKEGNTSILMGDDSTPRKVQAGSITRGNGPLFRIISANCGREPWICNGEHILVLKFNTKPWLRARRGRFEVNKYVLEGGRLKIKQVQSFATKEIADHQLNAQRRSWVPIVFECTVNDFMSISCKLMKRMMMMYQPNLVHFPTPQCSLKGRLEIVYKRLFTDSEAEETAWIVGMWLSDGNAADVRITQIGEDIRNPERSHAPIIARISQWFGSMHAELLKSGVTPLSRRTTTGNTVYHLALGPKFMQLLDTYDLRKNKHFPVQLLADSVACRRQLLAGVLDGDGWFQASSKLYGLCAKDRIFIDGFVHLARGLGCSVGAITKKQSVDKEGRSFEGWRVHIGGQNLASLQLTLPYKRFPSAGETTKPNKDSLCDGFSIEPIGDGDFYGFATDGNHRFLLHDFVVTHNSTT